LTSSTWDISLISSSACVSSDIDNSSDKFNSISDIGRTSTGSLISKLPSLIFFCSSFSLFSKSSFLAASSSSLILIKSL